MSARSKTGVVMVCLGKERQPRKFSESRPSCRTSTAASVIRNMTMECPDFISRLEILDITKKETKETRPVGSVKHRLGSVEGNARTLLRITKVSRARIETVVVYDEIPRLRGLGSQTNLCSNLVGSGDVYLCGHIICGG